MRPIARFVASATLVILLVTPNPLGLRPARAFFPVLALAALDPATLGAVVVGAGVISATAGHYAPAIANAADTVVSTGAVVTQTMYQVEKFAYGTANNIFVGGAEKLALSFTDPTAAANMWATANSTAVPNIAAALSVPQFAYMAKNFVTATTPPPVIPGDIIGVPYITSSMSTGASLLTQIHNQKITALKSGYPQVGSCAGNSWPSGSWALNGSGSDISFIDDLSGTTQVCPTGTRPVVEYRYTSTYDSADPATAYPPGVFDPAAATAKLASVPPTTLAAELEKVIAANPASVTGAPAMDYQKAQTIAQGVAAQNDATVAAQAALADPTNAAKASDAARLQAIADQAALAAQAAKDASTQPPASSDLPYTPSALAGPYTLPNVDFGQRLQQFFTSAKTSSLFGLPAAVFSVPSGGTSTITINGGQTFGTTIIDLADWSASWAILKTIVMCGFCFFAVRIVCLKGGSSE